MTSEGEQTIITAGYTIQSAKKLRLRITSMRRLNRGRQSSPEEAVLTPLEEPQQALVLRVFREGCDVVDERRDVVCDLGGVNPIRHTSRIRHLCSNSDYRAYRMVAASGFEASAGLA